MSKLNEILKYNSEFVEKKEYQPFHTTKYPDKQMVILTCMDTRLVELLPKAMNIRNGDAKIIKNAGALVSHPFGSIMRSILVAVYSLQAKEVFVIGHQDCGMIGLHATPILDKAKEAGVSPESIEILQNAGINIEGFLKGFESVEVSVSESVEMIKNHPLLPKDIIVHGLIIDSNTGKLSVLIDGNKQVKGML
ncbi:beta-class carbonic anhydrase [Bacillus sp. DJP31]|uniref:beta-class carbonic anhydrase n=1 Tax=Bacillus sp. DJP31 TaxID=3409789 RepID=UPI003BB4A1B2